MPTVTSGRYYTFNITVYNNANEDMAVLETAFNPVSITQLTASNVGYGQTATVTATLGATPSSGENFYLRYSTTGFSSSTVTQMTVNGTTASATIPGMTSGTVQYYVFSSNEGQTQLTNDFSTYNRQSVYDMATLNLSPTNSYTIQGLSGTYTINPNGSGTTNFTTMQAAFDALNNQGVAGAVLLSVKDGSTFNESNLNLIAPAGSSATNTITFRRDNSTNSRPVVQPPSTATPGQQDAVIKLQGADYVTFDGIDVSEFPSIAASALAAGDNAAMEYGYALFRNSSTDGCQHNTIQNCTVTLNPRNQNPTYGIYLATTNISGAQVNASSTDGANSYNSLLANTVNTASNGVRFAGSDGSFPDLSNVLGNIVGTQRGNTITGAVNFGLLVFNQRSLTIGSNSVAFTGTSTANMYGIAVGSNTPGAIVARNRVYSLKYTGSNGVGIRGISLDPGSITANIAVANNAVGDLTGDGNGASNVTQLMGIGILSGTGYNVWNNSVQLNGSRADNNFSNKVAAALYVANGVSGIDLRNNVLSNVQTTSDGDAGQLGTNYAVYAEGAGNPFSTIDYNLYDLRTGSNYRTAANSPQALGRLNGVDYTTLATWQTATAQDRSSMLSSGVNSAGFTSATNLAPDPLNSSAYVLNGMGVQITAVVADILGNNRPTTVAAGAPDLGAYEFNPIASPNPLEVSGSPTLGGTQTFTLNGRQIAVITYDATGSVPTSVTGRYYSGTNPPTPYPASADSQNDYFSFTNDNNDGNGFSYTLQTFYDPASLGTIPTESAQKLFQRRADNSGYTAVATSVDQSSRMLTSTIKLTRISIFAVSDQTSPLPVQLVTFAGTRTPGGVQLNWLTAQEVQNAGFQVERQVAGGKWQAIQFLPGQGTGQGRAYSYLDAAAPAGLVYYRLRQVDTDGTGSYSPVVAVNGTARLGAPALALYPVPTPADHAQLTIDLSTLPAADRTLVLYDLQGRQLAQTTVAATDATASLPVQGLAAGSYLVVVRGNGETYHARFNKL